MSPGSTTPVARVVRALAGLTAFAVVLGGGALTVSWLLGRDDRPPAIPTCWAVLDGTRWNLAPDQAETAALLAGTALSRAMPARALTIGLATGMQESKLRNIDHGDRDSVGIFQQRPSQGWGTVEEIMDPVHATNAFYDALVKVPAYTDLEITVAAQEVQRSAFPDAYAQHEGLARAWASAFYGYAPQAVTCSLPDAEGGDPQAVVERARRDLPYVPAVVAGDGVVLDAAGLGASAEDESRLAWALAHWAVAVAEPLQVQQVRTATAVWDREADAWLRADLTPGPTVARNQVLVVPAP